MLINSTVRGPAIVGRDTVVRDSYIGPYTSVYFGCEIVSTEIEHSVVLEQSRIEGVPRVQDSLIGKQVVVTRSEARPKATRLMLGDHSVVDLE
jgi:glucose-1-phosphate thymidylyltransferase